MQLALLTAAILRAYFSAKSAYLPAFTGEVVER
jgi:hypothetical protein